MVRKRSVIKDSDNFSNLEDDGRVTSNSQRKNIQRSKAYAPAYSIFSLIILCAIGVHFVYYFNSKWIANNVTEKANLPLATAPGTVDEVFCLIVLSKNKNF